MVDSRFGWNRFSAPSGQMLLGVLFILPVLSPSLFGWINGLLAVPVFCLLTANGKHYLLVSVTLAGLAALLVRQWEIFLFSLTLIPLGLVLFSSARNGDSAAMSGGKGFVTLGLTWMLFWGVQGLMADINPYSHLLKVLDLGLQETLKFYNSPEVGLSPEMIYSMTQATTIMREIIPRLLPGLLTIILISTVWANMVLVNGLTGRLTATLPWGSYTQWQLPDHLVWMPIVALALVLAGSGLVQDVGAWLLMVAGLLYFFQGLAVFIALLERWRVPFLVRIVLYIILTIQSYGMIILAVLGVAEVWLNLRKIEITTT